jgi:hypothetical protein
MLPLVKLRRDIEWQEARLLGDRHLISERADALKFSFRRRLSSPLALAAAGALGFGAGLLRHRQRPAASGGRLGPTMRELWRTTDRVTRLLAGSALAPLFWGKIGAALASRPATQQQRTP